MAFIEAERTQLYLRCALFGPSGSGKTMTALRMAKGIAEKMGGNEFAVIDTEARSASKYADRFSFLVDNLEGKTIDHYIAALDGCAKAGKKVVVIDSLSHAWRELTEEVDRIAQKSTNHNSFQAWGKVGPKQKKFIEAILNFPGHIIATMRSKTEWVIGEKNGKTAPENIGLAPEQGKDIEYEFDMLLKLDQNHQATVIKDRTGKFQDETIEKPDENFGAALFNWLNEGTEPPVVAVPQVKPEPPVKQLPKTEKSKKADPAILSQREKLIAEIGKIITSVSKDGGSRFTEDEKNQARQLIKTTTITEKGNQDLTDLKGFLAEELSKREAQKAA
jgi:nucleoside-triphosphatase THEP1